MTDIEPDTKDWSWVLDTPCSDCGYDSSKITRTDLPALLRATPGPLPKYSPHLTHTGGLRLMLTVDHPHYANWDQDATAVADRYGEQDPKRVATELTEAAETLAHSFEQVTEAEWHRTGQRSDGAHFTVDTFARYVIHDVIHHVHDVSSP